MFAQYFYPASRGVCLWFIKCSQNHWQSYIVRFFKPIELLSFNDTEKTVALFSGVLCFGISMVAETFILCYRKYFTSFRNPSIQGKTSRINGSCVLTWPEGHFEMVGPMTALKNWPRYPYPQYGYAKVIHRLLQPASAAKGLGYEGWKYHKSKVMPEGYVWNYAVQMGYGIEYAPVSASAFWCCVRALGPPTTLLGQ